MNKFKFLFLSILILLQIEPLSSQAQIPQFGELTNPSTVRFGRSAPTTPLSSKGLRLLVWNIHKGVDENLPKDFSNISFASDLTLLQEAISDNGFTTKLTEANRALSWTLAISFELSQNNYTGVATGSKTPPLREEALVSEVTEPIAGTPKTILLSEYDIENREDNLLVANIHGINFVTTNDFKTQIKQMLKKISSHQGPMIIAGDFNTWNEDRLDYLKKALAPLRMKLIQTPDPGGFFKLDHIFIRAFIPRFIFNLNHIESSDHKPLLVDLLFN